MIATTEEALKEIDTLIRARYSVLYLLTHEEARLEMLLGSVARKQNKPFFVWTATRGLRRLEDHGSGNTNQTDPNEVLQHILTVGGSGIYLLKDFHPFLNDPQIIRRLRDVAHDLKGTYKTILISAPTLNLPCELEKEVSLVDIPLPDYNELMNLFKSVCSSVVQKNKTAVQLNNDQASAIVRASQGLTLSEAENAFSKAVVNDGTISATDIQLVLKEKQQIIRKSGILEFYDSDSKLSDIGGLENLKAWLQVRANAFAPEATKFGLPSPKGVLLLGAPGCGKSLTAKAVGVAWQMPLLRLDFGKIFSGLVGSSEENMRKALKVAEGIAPAILWIDEIEKGLAGNTSGSSDGGAAARVFGTFLTWMQEKTAKVFVVATANRIDALPPELLRRGRFDEIFFMDLPESKSRMDILTIHLKKRGRNPAQFDLQSVVDATKGFSGSEIEHVVVEALFTAYHAKREVTTDDLKAAVGATVPLSVTYAEDLKRIRDWAKNRARSADILTGEAKGNRADRLEM